MAEITREEVRRIAALARLGLDPAEEERLAAQMERIVEAMARLRRVDVGDAAPLTHVLASLANVTRPDEPRPGTDREALLAAAPDRSGPFLRVPRVIE
ncbi:MULTISPECIES: Asp-tRNA(Asn)/Glu-tRNA(Gln) amidotransferase subunit GatC [Thermaerobacter]|uniref:Aspartyl/glutamyl-tRNA(Asn/Gln) amidotransferase subunit C n=1 Tax=Thermaerobacter composti TaxID=554949 RepID=A0ABZ0QPD2_9FIRM|nr:MULTISPECIES: Asp-tRNA(Asn)/Glu-tRNA(Gln) amidotransferase subunit GatC [Thermaerobacter]PZN08465.1 MAG: Asp-tRNA(Asn)/Glu-tRNA(Gln) amidotransferase subunit GatC [Bacillota bacterium]QBS37311.1 Asp-tRNA(Asn)/Glu-tRNA(Gln) amidotransferase subunit GatC [Thermaerobacter sp. FW80]WPD19345.1 Asp-tRNA(Asn)/Glu-tRNA(Gln) amidotransferase subunit GatC [Thermaerobacter composti]